MKIGILTLPIAENYGGILQAIALYRLLYEAGHNVVLIYKEDTDFLWKKILKIILKKIPFCDIKNLKEKCYNEQERQKRKLFHRVFIEQEIFNISRVLYTKKELENFALQEQFDAIIVGSDQVWRGLYITNWKYNKSYFLDFVDSKNTKKIAYGASFGTDYWDGKKDKAISKLLQDFIAVSVREISGIEICKNTFGYDKAVHVLDPTMLMSKDFYIKELIEKYNPNKFQKGGLLTYILDESVEKYEIVSFIKEILQNNKIHHIKAFNENQTTYSVPEWLSFFYNADFIITDSFHGCVFSIIFEKDFIAIANQARGLGRFKSLLEIFDLQDRLIFDADDLKNKNIVINKIDYTRINKILEKERKKSLNFLFDSLLANKGI